MLSINARRVVAPRPATVAGSSGGEVTGRGIGGAHRPKTARKPRVASRPGGRSAPRGRSGRTRRRCSRWESTVGEPSSSDANRPAHRTRPVVRTHPVAPRAGSPRRPRGCPRDLPGGPSRSAADRRATARRRTPGPRFGRTSPVRRALRPPAPAGPGLLSSRSKLQRVRCYSHEEAPISVTVGVEPSVLARLT
jgi:hypothetical protein